MKLILFGCLIALILASSLHAAVIEFPGERDAWFSAVGGEANVTTIGFTEYPNNTTLTDQYSNLGVTFEGLNFVEGPFPVDFHDSWGLAIFSGNHLYFDKPINWIAVDFLGTVKIELFDGGELFHTSQLFGAPLDEVFGGIVSDRAFDHVRIFDSLDPLTVLDDLHFGPPIAVPGPGAIALLPIAVIARLRGKRRCS